MKSLSPKLYIRYNDANRARPLCPPMTHKTKNKEVIFIFAESRLLDLELL